MLSTVMKSLYAQAKRELLTVPNSEERETVHTIRRAGLTQEFSDYLSRSSVVKETVNLTKVAEANSLDAYVYLLHTCEWLSDIVSAECYTKRERLIIEFMRWQHSQSFDWQNGYEIYADGRTRVIVWIKDTPVLDATWDNYQFADPAEVYKRKLKELADVGTSYWNMVYKTVISDAIKGR